MVVDLEATCFRPGERPEGAESEIIEIGWAWFDYPRQALASGIVSPGSSVAVKPSQLLSEYCTELTGLDNDMLSDAPSLGTVIEMGVIPQLAKRNIWASFGIEDYWMLRKSCEAIGVRVPFSDLHLDIKAWHHALFGSKKPAGLFKALIGLDMDFIGKQHTANDDALNAARVLKRLLSL